MTRPATPSVLIVDDDRAIVEVLADFFTDEGYVVRRAYDGLSALEATEIASPHLVLSDISMPGLNGVALTRRLRERGIPVILVSAAMRDPGLPGVPYLPKPFELEQLLALASQVLRHDEPAADT